MNVSLYNEHDPFAARWLAELVERGHISLGEVDERSIRDLKGADLDGRTQVHLFAGIGGWSYALRLAGWPDGQPVWTGSCPCQPFSSAGKKRGEDDERHLWPEMVRLIAECRPATVFGEQVASDGGRLWLSGVRADLEALGYAVGAADLCAASVGAPHIRQRLFWVAISGHERGERLQSRPPISTSTDRRSRAATIGSSDSCGLAPASDERLQGRSDRRAGLAAQPVKLLPGGSGLDARGLERADERISRGGRLQPDLEYGQSTQDDGAGIRLAYPRRASDEHGLRSDEARSAASPDEREARERERRWPDPWGGSVLIDCADGKARRAEPSIFPLAHGVPGRLGRLRAYGNAIEPHVAAQFIEAVMAMRKEDR